MTGPVLRRVAEGPAVVACNTCRFSADTREDADGLRGGALMAEALRTARARSASYDGIAVHEMPCLFACGDHCTVHLRAPGKIGYVLGRFVPGAEAAAAILDFAVAYAASDIGQVPYKAWPTGVRGHFLTRTPPEGHVVA